MPAPTPATTRSRFTANANSSTISTGTLISAALELGTQVTVSTGGRQTGTQAGNITINVFSSPSVNATTRKQPHLHRRRFDRDQRRSEFLLRHVRVASDLSRRAERTGRDPAAKHDHRSSERRHHLRRLHQLQSGRRRHLPGATGYSAAVPTGVDLSTATHRCGSGAGRSRSTAAASSRAPGRVCRLRFQLARKKHRDQWQHGGLRHRQVPASAPSCADGSPTDDGRARHRAPPKAVVIGLESQLILTNSSPRALCSCSASSAERGVLLDGSQSPPGSPSSSTRQAARC